MKPATGTALKFNLVIMILAAVVLTGGCRASGLTDKRPGTDISSVNQHPSPPPWPHEQSDLSPDPELIFGVLDNGFRYVLMENPRPEGRVRMHLNVDVGSFHETEEQRGVAHFLEHMLFSGTRNFPPGELVKYFQRIGMKFGPDVNGRTGFYNTTYDLDLPRGDEHTLAEGLLVMHDFAAEALLEPEEVIDERSVILAEKRTRDTPDYRTFRETFRFELPDTRIAERMPIGTKEIIENTDHDLLADFYHPWYRPRRLSLIAVGDIHPANAEKLIEQRFAGLTPGLPEKSDPAFEQFAHNGIKPFYHHEPEAGATRVAMEVMTRSDQPADSADYQKKKLLSEMANQIVQHRLDRLRNAADAPFTSADIYSDHFLRFVKAAEISASCVPENWQKSLSLLEQTLRKALEFGFTDAEVARVQKEFTTRLQQAVKTAPTRENGQIAQQILHHLNSNRVFQSPQQRKALLQPVVDGATTEALHEMLRADWAPSHRLVMVTGNADMADGFPAPEDKIARAYQQSRQTAVTRPSDSADIAFPYLPMTAGDAEIQRREFIEEPGITRVEFANNVTLLVKKTDFTANQVLAAISFGYGESVQPADQPALAEMSRKVINSSGLGKMSEDELKQALAGTSTRVTFNVEEDKFVFSARSVPDEIELMFQLFHAHLQDPGFRESALRQAANELRQKHQSLSHSVQGALALKGQRFLAGGDSRFGFPGLEDIEKTRLDDIRSWLAPAFASAPIEIAVVGDMDVDQVIDAAAAFFGTLPAKKALRRPSPDRMPDFPKGRDLDISVPTRISKALLLTAYPTTHIWDIQKARRLSVLSDIFSDRMRIRIREDLGASYAQGAYHDPSRAYPDYGLFATYAVIDPDKIETVEQAIAVIAADLHENGVSSDELKRALEPTLTGIREQLKTNDYWLGTVLKGAERHPVQLRWSRSLEKDYTSITVEEINRMARIWLEPENAAVIRIRPHTRGGGGENRDASAIKWRKIAKKRKNTQKKQFGHQA